MTVKEGEDGRRRPTAVCCFSHFCFCHGIVHIVYHHSRQTVVSHAGNYRNFETNSSINNDHVNRLYNWQQRMEQKKKMLKQKFVKENTPSFTPTKYSSKAGTSAVGKPQRAHTPTESSAIAKTSGTTQPGKEKRERKTSSLRTRKKMDWENYKTKSTSTKLPNATTKEKNAPSAKNRSKVNSYSSMYKTKTSVQQEPVPSISPTQSSLSKQAAASIASAMGDVKKNASQLVQCLL